MVGNPARKDERNQWMNKFRVFLVLSLLGLLGQPVHSEREGIIERLFYSLSISGQNNIIEIENDLVSYISIVFADEHIPRLSDVQAKLGQPEYTTFSTYMRGSRTYLFTRANELEG